MSLNVSRPSVDVIVGKGHFVSQLFLSVIVKNTSWLKWCVCAELLVYQKHSDVSLTHRAVCIGGSRGTDDVCGLRVSGPQVHTPPGLGTRHSAAQVNKIIFNMTHLS